MTKFSNILQWGARIALMSISNTKGLQRSFNQFFYNTLHSVAQKKITANKFMQRKDNNENHWSDSKRTKQGISNVTVIRFQ